MISKTTYHRLTAGLVMIGGLSFITYLLGRYGLVVMVFAIECKVFQELRQLAYGDYHYNNKNGVNNHYNSIIMDWFIFGICSFWVISESVWKPCRLLCINLYTLWFMISIGSFNPLHVQKQLTHLCWIHICVFFTAIQMYFVISNIMHGIVWFIFPTLLVVCNDITAYGCGRLVGQTSLFRLSPNKTLEGFVGAGIFTICCGYLLGGVMLQEDPYHGVVLALYASCAAPFGGFLASAIKRASDIKDFGQLIPGHGGMTDRMDCQLLMSVFTFAYRQYALS